MGDESSNPPPGTWELIAMPLARIWLVLPLESPWGGLIFSEVPQSSVHHSPHDVAVLGDVPYGDQSWGGSVACLLLHQAGSCPSQVATLTTDTEIIHPHRVLISTGGSRKLQ